MKILTTVSAVVFLMILTTGLATAKKPPVPTFPFVATGATSFVTDNGGVGEELSVITVNKASNGLFYGTIDFGGAQIVFSAAQDSAGFYNLNGIQTGPFTVIGKFTITYVKSKGFKGFEVAIQWEYPGFADYVAGTLSQ